MNVTGEGAIERARNEILSHPAELALPFGEGVNKKASSDELAFCLLVVIGALEYPLMRR